MDMDGYGWIMEDYTGACELEGTRKVRWVQGSIH